MVSTYLFLFLCPIKRFLQMNSVTCQGKTKCLQQPLLFLRNWKEIFFSGIPTRYRTMFMSSKPFLMQAFSSIFKLRISLEENQRFQIYKKKGHSVQSLFRPFYFWRNSSTPLPYKGVTVSWLCSHSVFSSLSLSSKWMATRWQVLSKSHRQLSGLYPL